LFLRTEAKMRFIKEQEKLEQKQLDEVATVSFVRRAQSKVRS
jgi:flagellar biosynthesis chaperone FliJ